MTPIDKAKQRLGDRESPPNSNQTLYGKWFGMDGQPWCMFFVQWCYAMAGYPIPYKTGSCSILLNWYKQNHPEKVLPNTAQAFPNDIIIYTFGHTGLVETASEPGSAVRAIEGNTSPSEGGSQDNGGMVCRKVRKRNLITNFIRPYDFSNEVEYMTITEFVDKMTPKEAYTLFSKAMHYLDAIPEPDWSKKEGHWANATRDKIVNGSPESYLKRDEMIAILGRLGVID